MELYESPYVMSQEQRGSGEQVDASDEVCGLRTTTSGLFSDATKKAMLIGQAVLFGTGSVFAAEEVDHWRDYVQVRSAMQIEANTVRSVREQGERKADLRSPAEHLDNILTTVQPSVSELSRVLGVSRQMMYRWMSGKAQPGQDRLERLRQMSQVADRFAAAGIVNPLPLLRMKAFDGQSLLDKLTADEPVDKDIEVLIAESGHQQKASERLGPITSPTRDDWQSDVSIPGNLDQA